MADGGDAHADTLATNGGLGAAVGVPPPACIGGRYDVLGWVGAGGMGSVYRVHDRELDEVVALKVLRREGSSPIRRAWRGFARR